jgi:site-specific DNA recombinase
VSSEGQEDNSSLSTQEAACRRYAAERGYVVDESHVYAEVHTGAEIFERAQMSNLRAAIRAHQIDVVVAYALDRLTRIQSHQGLLLSEADHAGGAIEFVTERLEGSPEGRLLLSVRGFVAEVERLKIAERTQRGKRARIDAGKYNVGCRPPYGYQWEDHATKDRLAEDPMTAPIVRRIFRDLASGVSARQLALRLTSESVPTPTGKGQMLYWSTIRTIVGNPVYWGEAQAYRWTQRRVAGRRVLTRPTDLGTRIPLRGVAPALVDADLALAVRESLTRNKTEATRNNRSPQSSLLRAGFARCGYCGNTLEVQVARGGWMYRCGTSNRDKHGCPYFSIMVHILDAAVWKKVEAILTEPSIIAGEVDRLRRQDPAAEVDIASVERRLLELARQRTNLTKRLALFDDEESAAPLVVEISALSEQIRQLQDDRSRLEDERRSWELSQHQLADLEYWCRVQAENLQSLTYDQKRLALRALDVRARVWASDHDPRYVITVSLDGLLPIGRASDLRTAAGDDLDAARVDDCSRRGCARPAGRRAGRL